MTIKAWEGVECLIECCVVPAYCVNLCRSHYNRYYSYGDPNVPLKFIPILSGARDKYDAKTSREQGCLTWKGAVGSHGYGMMQDDEGQTVLVHRWAYENFVSKIRKGMFIDHICGNRKCVDPAHLREVTPKQNAENITVARQNNSSGHVGVSWNIVCRLWAAYVGHNGHRYSVGYYPKYELHVAAYKVRIRRNELFTHNTFERNL